MWFWLHFVFCVRSLGRMPAICNARIATGVHVLQGLQCFLVRAYSVLSVVIPNSLSMASTVEVKVGLATQLG
ncbi:hypothetical protein BJV74DRAFT_824014 [Russula compacta]|nr:hypothetical protein BJV74DRAFT_824014 [Russula compacta]